MTLEANEKIKNILEKILTGYSLGKKYNYSLEYSVKGLLRDIRMNDSELELILKHLEEHKIIDNYVDTGDDFVITESTYTIYFPDDFRKRAIEYLNLQSDSQTTQPLRSISLEPKKPEIKVGELISYSDGSIIYDGENLNLRGQLKDLCRLFMENSGRLVLVDDIRDRLIDSNKRDVTPNSTLAKYVSELRGILSKKYQKEVIFNQKKEGWIFSPDQI